MSLLEEVKSALEPALAAVEPDAAARAQLLTLVRPTPDPKHGDYQANFAMPLAKRLKQKPQELAQSLVDTAPPHPLVHSLAVAGPGFINVTLDDAAVAGRVVRLADSPNLGVTPVAIPKRIVIDYSGPNVAKPLHVGHLRSTIIGDAIVRILRAVGHDVTGDNHLGDWGLQFGILIHGYKHHLDEAAFARDPVRELARLYVDVRKQFLKSEDEDDAKPTLDPVLSACREETAKLHAGDPENTALWHKFMPACLKMLEPIYARLDVQIDLARGESFYHPMLPGVVEELLSKGLASESAGAVVIPNANNVTLAPGEQRKGEEPPAIVRKRDGAYTYTTSDLATIRYRAEEMRPDVSLYVVDARQGLHFKTVFACARRWGYDATDYRHVAFGSILGADRKPLRTRDGGVYELEQLLNEAVESARANYLSSRDERLAMGHQVAELSQGEIDKIAEVVGVGGVKYADLSGNLASDYVFDLKQMLSPYGNTATYMQYAYARLRGIFRKGNFAAPVAGPVSLGTDAERQLALTILRYPDAVSQAATEYAPHLVCHYLWELGKAANTFYESCPVLSLDDEALRAGRLRLADVSARVLRAALGMLGIQTVEQM